MSIRHQSIASTSRDHHDSQVIVQGTPIILPEQRCQPDFNLCKDWTVFDPLLHTKIGSSKMKIRTQDKKTLFIDEQTVIVNYKPGSLDLFAMAKEQNVERPFLSNADSHGNIRTGFVLQFTNNRSLNSTNFLDTSIDESSHTSPVVRVTKN